MVRAALVATQTQPPSTALPTSPNWWRRALPDALGLLWVVAAGVVMLLPTLVHGAANIHDPAYGDQADAFIPWTIESWTQVHQGHLPLWNPYNVLGMPLAFNWGSAPFGLSSLVGYAFPVRMAFAAGLLTTLLVAGCGGYLLGRVLGLGILASVFGAVTLELSGSFVGWLGWTIAGVAAWSGWLLAATFLIVRGRRRLLATLVFALALAGAIYSGEPETLAQVAISVVVFAGVLLVIAARQAGGAHVALRPLRDLAVGTVCGIALGAPLLLPGLQLAAHSVNSVRAYEVYSRGSLPLSGVFGLTRGPYLGVAAIVLAVLGTALRRRRPETRALAALAVVMAAVTFVPPVTWAMNHVPLLGASHWSRTSIQLALALAVLGASGVDAVVKGLPATAARWGAAGFVGTGLVALVAIIAFPPITEKPASIIWAMVASVIGAAAMVAVAVVADRRPHGGRSWRRTGILAASTLIALETAMLVTAGIPVFTSAPSSVTPTFTYFEIKTEVGNGVLGFGSPQCFPTTLAILQNSNIAFHVHEFAVYDPLTPLEYFTSWKEETGRTGGVPTEWGFCPAITSTALARRYGINFVVEPPGAPGPAGSVPDGSIGNAKLFRIPGASTVTLVPLTARGLPGPDAPGQAVAVSDPDPSQWRMTTDAAGPGVLRLRLTNVPGWHATIDGHPLGLEPFLGIMLQARIPPGHHVIELQYRPAAFTLGLVLLGLAAIGLIAAFVVVLLRRGTATS